MRRSDGGSRLDRAENEADESMQRPTSLENSRARDALSTLSSNGYDRFAPERGSSSAPSSRRFDTTSQTRLATMGTSRIARANAMSSSGAPISASL